MSAENERERKLQLRAAILDSLGHCRIFRAVCVSRPTFATKWL